jgi:hypothetical protein
VAQVAKQSWQQHQSYRSERNRWELEPEVNACRLSFLQHNVTELWPNFVPSIIENTSSVAVATTDCYFISIYCVINTATYQHFTLHITPILTFQILSTQRLWITEQTAIISLYNINWLVCVTETECLLCGTDWVFIYK